MPRLHDLAPGWTNPCLQARGGRLRSGCACWATSCGCSGSGTRWRTTATAAEPWPSDGLWPPQLLAAWHSHLVMIKSFVTRMDKSRTIFAALSAQHSVLRGRHSAAANRYAWAQTGRLKLSSTERARDAQAVCIIPSSSMNRVQKLSTGLRVLRARAPQPLPPAPMLWMGQLRWHARSACTCASALAAPGGLHGSLPLPASCACAAHTQRPLRQQAGARPPPTASRWKAGPQLCVSSGRVARCVCCSPPISQQLVNARVSCIGAKR